MIKVTKNIKVSNTVIGNVYAGMYAFAAYEGAFGSWSTYIYQNVRMNCNCS